MTIIINDDKINVVNLRGEYLMIKDFKGVKPKIHKTCYLSESINTIY